MTNNTKASSPPSPGAVRAAEEIVSVTHAGASNVDRKRIVIEWSRIIDRETNAKADGEEVVALREENERLEQNERIAMRIVKGGNTEAYREIEEIKAERLAWMSRIKILEGQIDEFQNTTPKAVKALVESLNDIVSAVNIAEDYPTKLGRIRLIASSALAQYRRSDGEEE